MLVPVPWQPGLYVHRDLLVKMEGVRRRVGYPPMLHGPLSGWRSYATQKALWDAYQAGTGNVASNPDTGNRTHMRGVAGDWADTSARMQAACRAVGLVRDPLEDWHWQLANWRDYPIIPEMPGDSEEGRRRRTAVQWINRGDNGPWALIQGSDVAVITDKGAAERQSKRLGFQSTRVDEASWDEAMRQADALAAKADARLIAKLPTAPTEPAAPIEFPAYEGTITLTPKE
jgi:hypothetical protein